MECRVDKPFVVAGKVKVSASMDVFNLLNENTVMAQRRTQNASTANLIANILSPRVVRFGFRLTF